MSEGKFDPHRRLCPDGACIGVVGNDGRCHVCGRLASGGASAAAPEGFAPVENEGADDDGDEDEDADEAPVSAAGAAGFDPKRRLCPDGDCLGVIGADGVCNVCGKKAD